MKKSDLKNGMIVTLRRGVERIIIGGCLFNEEGTITSKLDYYKFALSIKSPLYLTNLLILFQH